MSSLCGLVLCQVLTGLELALFPAETWGSLLQETFSQLLAG